MDRNISVAAKYRTDERVEASGGHEKRTSLQYNKVSIGSSDTSDERIHSLEVGCYAKTEQPRTECISVWRTLGCKRGKYTAVW